MAQTIDLNGSWQLSFLLPGEKQRRVLPATVPGEAEAELAKNGLLGDLIPPDRIDALYDTAPVEWEYSRSFTTPAVKKGEKVYLVFDGIDTGSSIFLNGELILETDNALIPHQTDVTGKLNSEGEENALTVVIQSDVERSEERVS